jgi:hypothetical protein
MRLRISAFGKVRVSSHTDHSCDGIPHGATIKIYGEDTARRTGLKVVMFAKNMESILARLCEKSDVSHGLPNEFTQRFDALRGYGRLPRGREKRGQSLTSGEITAAILGLTPAHPNWAGHAAILLSSLHTVGGVGASFLGTSTLQESIERILTDAAARLSVVKLTASVAEGGVNSHGYASLIYEIEGVRHRAFYVPKEAVSLLQPGAEKTFDPANLHSPVSRETTFNRAFFARIAREIERAKAFPVPPAGDGSEYDAEEARQERYKKLDVRQDSRFLNIGVDNQVTWPKEETLVKFDKYTLVLMPKTGEHVQSIHIDLTANRLTDREAITVVNRFLSILTWCDDQFAIAQGGWSGNPVPVPVPKRDLAFTTAYDWAFDRRIPASEPKKRALALYREARNAEQNFMVSYAVLNYFKIIEITKHSTGEVKNWFRDNFAIVTQDPNYKDELSRFSEICGAEKPHEYIYKSCRIAVAHANKDSKSDPDDPNELLRLHKAAHIMRILARHFITTEFKISDVVFSGD